MRNFEMADPFVAELGGMMLLALFLAFFMHGMTGGDGKVCMNMRYEGDDPEERALVRSHNIWTFKRMTLWWTFFMIVEAFIFWS